MENPIRIDDLGVLLPLCRLWIISRPQLSWVQIYQHPRARREKSETFACLTHMPNTLRRDRDFSSEVSSSGLKAAPDRLLPGWHSHTRCCAAGLRPGEDGGNIGEVHTSSLKCAEDGKVWSHGGPLAPSVEHHCGQNLVRGPSYDCGEVCARLPEGGASPVPLQSPGCASCFAAGCASCFAGPVYAFVHARPPAAESGSWLPAAHHAMSVPHPETKFASAGRLCDLELSFQESSREWWNGVIKCYKRRVKPETLPFLDTHQEWTRNHRALGYKFTCQFTSLLFPLVALCYVPTVCQHPFHPNGCNDRNPYVHWINASESSEFDWVCPLKIGYPQIPRFIIIFHQKSTDFDDFGVYTDCCLHFQNLTWNSTLELPVCSHVPMMKSHDIPSKSL